MADFVTTAGLKIKTVQEILDELAAKQKADIDANLNTAPDSPMGQLNGIFASQLREAWEVVKEAYDGFSPDDAEGYQLEKLSGLTGTKKRAATKGEVTLTCNLNINTVLTAGTHFASVSGQPTNRWTPKANFTAPSTGNHSVVFVAEFAGVVTANAGTIIVISTPVTGWNSVTNPADAKAGINADTDALLRTRREQELRATGAGTLDALRADLLAFTKADGTKPIEQVSGFENITDLTSADGLPPHSFEMVVYDGAAPGATNTEIAQVIWNSKPAGIASHGTLTANATDTLGNLQPIKFSRPTIKNVWLELDVFINQSSGYAGQTSLKTALIDKGKAKLLVGRDLIVNDYKAVAMGLAGVVDVTALRAGFAASPVGTANLVLLARELAVLDTSRITIFETLGTPP